MGRDVGVGFEREGTHVYLMPIRVNVWQKPSQYCNYPLFLLQCIKVKSESEVAQSCPTLATPWTAAYQAPPSMGFSRQKYWSGVPLPSLKNVKLDIFKIQKKS